MTIPAIPQPAATDLFLTREFAAPPETVWALWFEPEQLQRWFGPREVHIDPASVAIEARPGGRWDLDMVDNETGEHFPMRARFSSLTPPHYFDGVADADAGLDWPLTDIALRVWFEPTEAGTRVTIVQGPFEPEVRDQTEHGWRSSFDKADALLASGR